MFSVNATNSTDTERNTFMERYLDTSFTPKERAKDLLSRMDLTEKTRQLGCTMILPMLPIERQDLKGGIGAATVMGSEDLPDDIRKLQDYIMDHSPHHIPALFHSEALAGTVAVPGANQYPISIGLGATFSPEIVEEMCEITRKQMVANGIRHALSPVCDLARDLRWGRTNECYGNDPTLSSAMTVAFVRGLQGENLSDGVAACGKHFLAYSQTEGGLNMHKSMADPREVREQFAKPFEAAIQLAGLKTIMNSYSSINGKPVVASREILTNLLRGDLGFDGVVVSDYTSIPRLVDPCRMAENSIQAGILALKAGLDIECPSRECYGDVLTEAVRDGRLDESYVDIAVLRILTLKFELGLFENPYPREKMLAEFMAPSVGQPESYHAAQKTMTLMKNNGILPLTDPGKKIAVIGPTGNCLRMMFSHYTAIASLEMMANLQTEGDTQQGYDISGLMEAALETDPEAKKQQNNRGDIFGPEFSDKYAIEDLIRGYYPKARTIFEALKDSFDQVSFAEGCDYHGDDASGITEAASLAASSDIVILCVGGKNGIGSSATSGEGVDCCTLDLPGCQEELMREVYRSNPNVIVVHTDARPLVSEWAYEHVPAILEAWLPNTYGGNAIADVLTGRYNPAGRTPVDVPRSVGHLPVYHYQQNGSSAVHNRHMIPSGYAGGDATVLAPFGYGLSYTAFSYSNGRMTSDEQGKLVISVDVTNTGDRDGEEVVQLYGSDLFASVIRPIHELIGFRRIFLKAGETKTVTFSFRIDILSFIDENNNWIVEEGDFRFVVGSHSEDCRAEFSYRLPHTRKINPNQRCFYADSSVN